MKSAMPDEEREKYERMIGALGDLRVRANEGNMGFDEGRFLNVFGKMMEMLMLGWRIINKEKWIPYPQGTELPVRLSVTIQSLDKKEWKRLYRPTFNKLLRLDMIETVEQTSSIDGDFTTILAIRKGA